MTGRFWTPEQDAILLSAKNAAEAGRLLGKSRRTCCERLHRLQQGVAPRRNWTAEEDALLLSAPSSSAAARMLGRTRQSCVDRKKRLGGVSRKPPEDFLALLARHERPPATVAVNDRQPLLRNASFYEGGYGHNPLAME